MDSYSPNHCTYLLQWNYQECSSSLAFQHHCQELLVHGGHVALPGGLGDTNVVVAFVFFVRRPEDVPKFAAPNDARHVSCTSGIPSSLENTQLLKKLVNITINRSCLYMAVFSALLLMHQETSPCRSRDSMWLVCHLISGNASRTSQYRKTYKKSHVTLWLFCYASSNVCVK